jgi:hypothetical protein
MEPFIDKILQMRDGDDVMEEIRRQQKQERSVDDQLASMPAEEVGTDEYTYVFATWDGVIDFLTKLEL